MRFLKGIYHYLLSWLGNAVYKSPSSEIFVLGITGTNGKSTTVELVNTILERAGKKTALSSSIRVKIADTVSNQKGSMTMPGRLFLQRLLRRAVDAGCDYAILEVTSEGIRQHRHRFIHFNAVMFLNISLEHVESHGSFERYLKAKTDLFAYTAWNSKKENKLFFVNGDDEHKEDFIKVVGEKGTVVEFSKSDFKNQVGDIGQVNKWLSADFNIENASAAAAFVATQSISRGTVLQSLAEFHGVPGRMEYIQSEPFSVVIDLALTPKALEGLYKTLREKLQKDTKLICVLGAAGGGRDTWKRPALGKLAEEYCDVIILTDDEPYDEDPEKIRQEIKSGINSTGKLHMIPDRKTAILEAVQISKPKDIVAVTGMGDLRFRHMKGGKKNPWSEHKTVEEALARIRH